MATTERTTTDSSPQSATAPTGNASAGPAVIFSWGSIAIGTQGSLGPGGSVTSCPYAIEFQRILLGGGIPVSLSQLDAGGWHSRAYAGALPYSTWRAMRRSTTGRRELWVPCRRRAWAAMPEFRRWVGADGYRAAQITGHSPPWRTRCRTVRLFETLIRNTSPQAIPARGRIKARQRC